MNAIERIRAAIHFKRTDRPAVVPEIIGAAATMCGVSVRNYVRSGEAIAECQLEARRMIGGDAVFAVADMCVEAEALGCALYFPDDNYPYVTEPAFKAPFDLEQGRTPDPSRDGRMPELLKAVRLLKEESGGAFPVIASAIGPITLAARIMDVEKMLYMIVDEPDRFTGVLEFCRDVSTAFALALIAEGADGVMVFDPIASPSVLPAKIFRRFEESCVRYVFGHVKEAAPGAITWYSVAGPVQTNLSIITGVAADITTVDYLAPIESVMGHAGYTVINGNIKPNLFLEGDEKDIRAEAKKLLAATRHTERFILGSGCEIPLYSKRENVAALARAVAEEAERFDAVNEPGAGSHEITILPHRKKVNVHPGATLLDAAQRAGVAIATCCDLSGSCGECIVDVSGGNGLEPPEQVETTVVKAAFSGVKSVNGLEPPEQVETVHNGGGMRRGERLACRAKVIGPVEMYVPYSSRQLATQSAVTGELYEPSVMERMGHDGFSPGVRPLRLEPGGESGEAWLERPLAQYHANHAVRDGYLPPAEKDAGETYAVIDASSRTVLDVSLSGKVYGMAVDAEGGAIGAYLHDLQTGRLIGVASVDSSFDTSWTVEDARSDRTLIALRRKKLFGGLDGLVNWFHNNCSIVAEQVYQVIVAGAPFVGALLAEAAPDGGKPDVTALISGARNMRFEVLPPVGADVGSSVVAGALAAGMCESDEPSLFLHVSDRGAAALGGCGGLLVAPVTASGIFARPVGRYGLIHSVAIDGRSGATYETCGGSAPLGLCGSAMIGLMAELLQNGVIDRKGRFVNHDRWPQLKNDAFVLVPRQNSATYSPISVTAKDIEQAQKDKAAYRAAVELLMREAGVGPKQVRRVYVSGSLGVLIDIDAAEAIGMIPRFPSAEKVFIKHAAGVGVRMAMLSQQAKREWRRIAKTARRIDPGTDETYADMLAEHTLLP